MKIIKDAWYLKLLLRSLVIMVVCVMFGFGLFYTTETFLENNLKRSLLETAKQGASSVANELKVYTDTLQALATLKSINNPDIPIADKFEVLRNEVKRIHFQRIGIADLNGKAQNTDGVSVDVKDRQYFQKALQGSVVVSDPIISRVDGRLSVIFAVPLFHHGKVVGVLYSIQQVEILSRITDKIRYGKQGTSFIVNSDGRVLAHHDRSLVYTSFNKSYKKRLESTVKFKQSLPFEKTGAREYKYQGIRKYLGYAPIKGTGWFLAIGAPRDEVFENINQVMLIFKILSLTLLLALTGYATYALLLQRRLRKEAEIASEAITTAGIMLLELDLTGKIREANSELLHKLAMDKQELLGKDLCQLSEDCRLDLTALRDYKGNLDFSITRRTGQKIYGLWHVLPNEFSERGGKTLVLMGLDITDTVRKEEEMMRLAYYDGLTSLPNRALIVQQLGALIDTGLGEMQSVAILLVYIDNFKRINDTFGYQFGDALLIQSAQKLRAICQEKMLLSRFGGDEFLMVMPRLDELAEMDRFAEEILKRFDETFEVDEHRIHLTCSIGISFYPRDGQSVAELLNAAELAAQRAKLSGKKHHVIFNRALAEELTAKLLMENALREALKNREFSLHYQPQFQISDRRLHGFEALLRWKSAKYGWVSPVVFIKLAEETGLINDIGKWVIDRTFAFAARLAGKGLCISCNISPLQLMQTDFVADVIACYGHYRLSPGSVALEVTESSLIESVAEVTEKLEQFQARGIQIYLDDFGTGYSSLTYLKNLPVNVLKIDKSFVDHLATDAVQSRIIHVITVLAHELGMVVVAEGVEDFDQLAELSGNGCDYVQGYLLGKPVPETEALSLVRSDLG